MKSNNLEPIDILLQVAEYFKLEPFMIHSPSRETPLPDARAVYFLQCKERLNGSIYSEKRIGRTLNRDGKAVYEASRKLRNDSTFKKTYLEFKESCL